MTDEIIKEHLQNELKVFKNKEIEFTLQIENAEKMIEERKVELEKLRELIEIIENFVGEKENV